MENRQGVRVIYPSKKSHKRKPRRKTSQVNEFTLFLLQEGRRINLDYRR